MFALHVKNPTRLHLNFFDRSLIGGVTLLAVSFFIARFARQEFDYPITHFVNQISRHSVLIDSVMYMLTTLDLVQGVALMGGIWVVWFDSAAFEIRARLVSGLIAASLAGLLSRAIQTHLAVHLRPIHDPAVGFVAPYFDTPDTLSNWSSFPSDHASLLFGLAFLIFILRPRFGGLLFAWTMAVIFSRLYEGQHFVSDLSSGLGLAMVLVTLSQTPYVIRLCMVFPRWASEPKRAGLFYGTAFVISYSVATLFYDFRTIGRGVAHFLHS